jgi:hypothetical protein
MAGLRALEGADEADLSENASFLYRFRGIGSYRFSDGLSAELPFIRSKSTLNFGCSRVPAR